MSIISRYPGARLIRRVRWLSSAHNPLCRPADRIEAAALVILSVLFLIAVPLASWAGARTYQGAHRDAAVAAATHHRVVGVLVTDAPGPYAVMGVAMPALAIARWPAPAGIGSTDGAGGAGAGGTTRTGYVRAVAGSPAGTRVTVWTDGTGQRVNPPATEASAVAKGVGVGVLAVGAAGTALAGCHLLLRRFLDRGRLAAWDAEWARVAPQWRR